MINRSGGGFAVADPAYIGGDTVTEDKQAQALEQAGENYLHEVETAARLARLDLNPRQLAEVARWYRSYMEETVGTRTDERV